MTAGREADGVMILTGTYDPVLVALSIAVAIMASYAALDLGSRVLASEGWKRILWLAMAAVAMGGGIWSMHFIAMLAFVLPIPVEYDFKLTVISLLAAIVATGAGFYVVAGNPQQRRRLAVGGILIGAGIVGMHYTGMSAMLMPCSLRYDLRFLVASIVIAVGAANCTLARVQDARCVATARRGSTDGGCYFRDALHRNGSGDLFADDAGGGRYRICGSGAYSTSSRGRGADYHHSVHGAACFCANASSATRRAD
jgi:NO-binding membrane sensor protein with MHYT domain